ncbi:signal peptidase II [candidate division KSB1 bacterium]|nr:signal peptidase II [candidate division KSB1 bacterium]RQW11424.1 MAG: signal peptidase II [candidate division KSB1 bacterium]
MKSLKILSVTAIVVLLDQMTKIYISHSMQLHQSDRVLGDFFRITYVENAGMAFGIKVGHSGFFTIFAVIASLAIMLYLFRMKGEKFLARFSMALILGGAIGNVGDRIIRGSVVDYLDFEFFDINIPPFQFLFIDFPGYTLNRWPVFNVADCAITVGMLLLFIFILTEKPPTELEHLGDAEMIH